MAKPVVMRYRLPVSVLIVSGTLRRTLDRALKSNGQVEQQPAELVSHRFAFRTDAESRNELQFEIAGNPFFSSKNSFTFTTDGRLASASTESTGHLGEVVASLAQVVGTVAGAVALGSEQDPRWDAYLKARPEEAGYLRRLEEARDKLRLSQDARYVSLSQDGQPDDDTLRQAWQKIHNADQILVSLNDRVIAAAALFDAWKAKQVETLDTEFSFAVPLSDLPIALESNAYVVPEEFIEPTDLVTLWTNYGVSVVARWPIGRNATPQALPTTDGSRRAPARERRTVHVRRAEKVELNVVEKRGEAVVASSRIEAVVGDSYSPHEAFVLRRTLFGRRSVGLTFTPDGFLSGVSTESDATAATVARTAAALPSSITTGVESSTALRSGLNAAARAQLDGELAATKAALELQQAKVDAAGLSVTAQDASRLARLAQLKSMYESQVALTGANPELTAWAREQVALLG